MIKINRFLYVHFTFFMIIAAGYISRNPEIIAVSYACVFIHELAHLLAAVLIGLKPSQIIFYPFGVNLRLANTIVYGLAEEILLYLSGPLANILLALFALPFLRHGGILKIFYVNNIALFVFNLLPVLPMDGGMIAKRLLAYKFGHKNSVRILRTVSALIITALILFEAYLAFASRFNFSVVFVSLFLLGNVLTGREKYSPDFLRELMYSGYRGGKIKKAKTYIVRDDASYRNLAENFAQGSRYVVFKEDENGKITEAVTDREIIGELLK